MKWSTSLRNTAQVLVKVEAGNPTGLTGLYQHPNPRPALIAVYEATLRAVSKLPPESVYRSSVESFTRARLGVVKKNETNEAIETEIGAGLVEEILVQAGEEYTLVQSMLDWQPWTSLENPAGPGQWD